MNDTPNHDQDHACPPSGTDPLLTAYALGELDPQSEDYKTIAAKVAGDAALREQIEHIQQLAGQLTQSYDQAAGPGLGDDALTSLAAASSQYEAECDTADETHTTPLARIQPKPSMTRRLLPYAGVAACTALTTAGFFTAMRPEQYPSVFTTAGTSKNTSDIDLQSGTSLVYEVQPATPLSKPISVSDYRVVPTDLAEPTPFITFAIPDSLAFDERINKGIVTPSNRPDMRTDLGIAQQPLMNIEATTPLADILTFPGDWPALTGLRIGGLEEQTEKQTQPLESQRSQADSRERAGDEKRKIKEVQTHLRSARQHQLNQDYDKALTELEAAQFLDPKNPVIKAYREMIQDTQLAIENFGLKRNRDLDIKKQALELANAIEARLIDIEHREEIRTIERERRERFAELTDNPFKLAEHEPLSTFSVDVDTASYAYGRRALLADQTMPAPDAVRIEEWINYFDYGYTAPIVSPKQLLNGRLTTAALEKLEAADETFVPFATDVEVVACPWTEGNQLVRIGIQAMEVAQDDRPPAHLVFLLDVSGSMNSRDKLGLVQQGMPLLLDQLNGTDKVSIVVYAGASGLVLEAAEAADKNKIKEAITQLTAGGSTAGGEGIQLAYDIAKKHFITGGINRVILCTDGDFNVGTSDTDELVELVKAQANPALPAEQDGKEAEHKGVYLSVMGFGTGNLNDEMMEKITNAGNGNYHYIDSLNEAVKTMSDQAGGTLVTVAKDVKLQVEFNPAKVASYRLIGYENRVLKNEDFNNDTVDAGDIGAGHSVTALYEIVPIKEEDTQAREDDPVIDELRYQKPRGLAAAAKLPELLTLKLRYKPVDAKAEQGTSRKVVKHVPAQAVEFDQASEATRFASSVAAMGMILRGSPHKGAATTQWVIDTAQNATGHDPRAYREEFVRMATQVDIIQTQRDNAFREDLVD